MADPAQQAIIGKLVEYLVDALKDQVSYLCCYSCNVPKLAEEVGKLNEKYEGVQVRASAARDNLENITPEVESWQKRVEKVQEDNKNIDAAAEQVGKSCLCKRFPVLHYSLSRDAVKTTGVASELLKAAPAASDPISIPRRPAEIDPVPHPCPDEFRSRDEIEAKIMDALMDRSGYLIGLHGMGGIGKTTLARKIEARARKEKSIFQHVVMATISQQPNLPKIQNDIAEGLGLNLSGDQSLNSRAKILHERLKAANGVLVILDDVWEILKLDDLGIPSQKTHPGCKLVLISRDKQNFNTIGNPKSEIFVLGILKEEESWILFRDNAGDEIDSPDLIEIANDIVKECNGLPLALEVVGCALRGKNKSYWEIARTELRKSMPRNISGLEPRVYQPLMYSIERLESLDARHLFLLCCLFPEDYKISLEELVRCGMGLKIFEAEELMEARKKVEIVLENLISHSLLIKSTGRDTLHVQMHDLIRDVGIWIASKKKIESEEGDASKEKHVFMISHGKEKLPMREEESYGCYTCISLRFSQRDANLPECMDCPRLELLHIGLMESWKGYINVPTNFFARMGRLRVLEASNFISIPSSVHLLENLPTLNLYHCNMFGAVSVIGMLINLESLCLKFCLVDVLPKEIGGLKKLRQLNISYCSWLRIAFGVISGLDQLEELVIIDSFDNWEAQAIETTNASLVELHHLNYLTTLVIQIQNPSVVPTERPHWVRNVKEYSITVSESAKMVSRFHKAITWEYGDIPLRDWLCDMVSDAEYLDLAGSSCFKAVSSNGKSLKFLSLSRLTNLQYLAEGQQNGAIFPMLKSLYIKDSCSLLKIFNVPPPVGSLAALEIIELRGLSGLTNLWEFPTEKLYLSNLKSLIIHSCEKLGYILSLSIAQSLSQLENLKVSNCPMMEEIFKKEDGEMKIEKLEFPKLEWLILESMESLCRFCKGMDKIEVSALSHLELKNLSSITGTGTDNSIFQLCLFEQEFAGNFSGLQNLSVESIHQLKRLFSPSILSGFSNLEMLDVEDCSELEEVIGKDENVGETTIFPKLKKLKFFNLPKIITFCYTTVELPSLEELHIKDCPMMEGFSRGLSNTTNSRFNLFFFSKEFAGSFSGLQILRMESIHKFKCLLSSSILSGFPNLEELTIGDCTELEVVIGKDENVGDTTVFPKLKQLYLSNLPKVLTFCYNDVELPSLERLWITSCPLMERFSQRLSDTSNSRFSLPLFNK